MLIANPDAYYSRQYQACALANKEKVSCFLYLLQFENTISIRQTKIEYAWSDVLPSNSFR